MSPRHQDYTFQPQSIDLHNVQAQITDQHFTAVYTGDYTISGMVLDMFDQPLADVTMTGFPVTTFTDEAGFYQAAVPSGWSGTILPAKEGYAFIPEELTFTEVHENLGGKDFQSIVVSSIWDAGKRAVKVFPNPTRGKAKICLPGPVNAQAKIEIATLQGEVIVAHHMERGAKEVNWNGKAQDGTSTPTGIYICRIVANEQTLTTTMLVIIP